MSKVKLKLRPRFTVPLSNSPVVLAPVEGPSVEVTVCGEASLLVQVTLVPTLTVSVGGENAKPAIAAAALGGRVDRGVPEEEVVLPPPPPPPLPEGVAVGVLSGVLLPPSPATTVGVSAGVLLPASGVGLLTGAALVTGDALLADDGVAAAARAGVLAGVLLPAAWAVSAGLLPPQATSVSSAAAPSAATNNHGFFCMIDLMESPSQWETRDWFIARARTLPLRRAP